MRLPFTGHTMSGRANRQKDGTTQPKEKRGRSKSSEAVKKPTKSKKASGSKTSVDAQVATELVELQAHAAEEASLQIQDSAEAASRTDEGTVADDSSSAGFSPDGPGPPPDSAKCWGKFPDRALESYVPFHKRRWAGRKGSSSSRRRK